jgi:hypothetical protein
MTHQLFRYDSSAINNHQLPQYLRLVWLESRVDLLSLCGLASLNPFELAIHNNYSFYERQVWAQNSVFLLAIV